MAVTTIKIDLTPCWPLTISVELPAFTGGGGLCLGGPLIGEKTKIIQYWSPLRQDISFLCTKQKKRVVWLGVQGHRQSQTLSSKDVLLCRDSIQIPSINLLMKNSAIKKKVSFYTGSYNLWVCNYPSFKKNTSPSPRWNHLVEVETLSTAHLTSVSGFVKSLIDILTSMHIKARHTHLILCYSEHNEKVNVLD